MKKNDIVKPMFSWKRAAGFLLILWIVSVFINLVFFDDFDTGNVAVIDVKGVISAGSSVFDGANPDSVIGLIDEADNNPLIKAIVIEINSGGGSPVASDEIAQRIERLTKPNVAIIRDIGASGAYWIATSSDHIMANRMSLVGSIGVTGAYLSFENFLDRYNVTYNRMVAGKYKDLGTPFKELTLEEEEILNSILYDLRDEFITQVANNRNMSFEEVENISTGQVWLGKNALEMGLIDSIGSEYELTKYLEGVLNDTVSYSYYAPDKSFTDLIYGAKIFSNGIEQGMDVKI